MSMVPQKVFKENKSVVELVTEFKKQALNTMRDKKQNIVIIGLSDLERFFLYTSNDKAWNWLPKRFRDALNKIGVHVIKKRSRNAVTVYIDDFTLELNKLEQEAKNDV